jgi:hypothetical protein
MLWASRVDRVKAQRIAMPTAALIDDTDTSAMPMQVERPYISAKRDALRNWDNQSIPVDLISRHVDEFEGLAKGFIDEQASEMRREFAYGRLLGSRGTLCRLCPVGATELLPSQVVRKWERAERLLRSFLESWGEDDTLRAVIMRVEEKWIASAEAYLDALMMRMKDADVESQLGLLKSIDAVALHLGQREVFRKTETLKLPMVNAHEMKLRVRLVALYIMVHASAFDASIPVIKRYRETFRICDPAAYPWWFIDFRLTDKQLAWTYRRLSGEDLTWRF